MKLNIVVLQENLRKQIKRGTFFVLLNVYFCKTIQFNLLTFNFISHEKQKIHFPCNCLNFFSILL